MYSLQLLEIHLFFRVLEVHTFSMLWRGSSSKPLTALGKRGCCHACRTVTDDDKGLSTPAAAMGLDVD